MLAAWLLTTLHHEVGISAGAAPLAFDAFGMGASANDGVSAAVCRGIFNSPDMRACALHSAMHGTSRALANFPCVKLLATHEARTIIGTHQHGVRQDVDHGDAKRISSAASDVEMNGAGHEGNLAKVSEIYDLVFSPVKRLNWKS